MLSRYRIVDATDRLGWLAGRILADLGGDVVKVDPPGTDRSAAAWRAFNVNKRVCELDLGGETGRARLDELLDGADLVLATPRWSDLAGALDPVALRRRHPHLIVVSLSPFGGSGPRRHWRASDIELMAAGGAMALAGEGDGPPTRVSEPQSYGWAGAQAAIGALVALFRRATTGRGELVDVSAQAAVVTALAHAPTFWDVLGVEPRRAGAFMTGRSVHGARFRVFWPCRDGWLNFIFYGGTAGRRTNEQLLAWMREAGVDSGVLGEVDWARFDPTSCSQAEVDALEEPVLRFFAAITKRQFLEQAHRREMLGYPVSTVADIAADPQLAARGFWQEVAGPDGVQKHCGSFAVVDGLRPPLRHAAGEALEPQEQRMFAGGIG